MIRILTRAPCDTCKGKAFLHTDEEIIIVSWKYFRRKPSDKCNGIGTQIKWIDLTELARLLEELKNNRPSRRGIL